MLDSALDVCQHAPKFIADKTCLGAPGGRILAKCGIKFVGWMGVYTSNELGGDVHHQ